MDGRSGSGQRQSRRQGQGHAGPAGGHERRAAMGTRQLERGAAGVEAGDMEREEARLALISLYFFQHSFFL